MLQLGVERCSRVSPVCKYLLIIISVKILHKCDETALTVTHIAVGLMLKSEKWPLWMITFHDYFH